MAEQQQNNKVATPTTPLKPDYIGHRERLRKKLLECGDNVDTAFADYELLELLLTIAIPRRDVKPLAKKLITKFGSFAGVINANPNELSGISGIGETTVATIKIVRASIKATLKSTITEHSIISNWRELVNYCQANIGCKQTEEFHILYLNTKCQLIKDETHSTGTVNSSSVYPREILKHVLDIGATSIILVHNHPSSDISPSSADISITQKIRDALKTIDVPIHDHIIVGKGNFFSFKSFGII